MQGIIEIEKTQWKRVENHLHELNENGGYSGWVVDLTENGEIKRYIKYNPWKCVEMPLPPDITIQ